jgi:SAM-dependent methyltransferase
MRIDFLSFLVCPECEAELDLTPFRSVGRGGEEIEEGLLRCRGCAYPYPVTGGIPRLLPNAFGRHSRFARNFAAELAALSFQPPGSGPVQRFERLHRLTARAFGYEWNTYRTTPWEEDVVTFFWLTGADPGLYERLSLTDVFSYNATPEDARKVDESALAGTTVLDIGCGMGKYLRVVSKDAKAVIGLDLSDALLRARTVVGDRPNVHLVQGNILSPPLRPESIDFAYSVGVLHHTPDAHVAFLRSASLVKPGGRLAVWLYPMELSPNSYSDWVHWLQDAIVRPVTCRMPPRLLRVFAGILGRLTFARDRAAARYAATGSRLAYMVAKYTGAVAVGRHQDPEIAAFLNFDWYSPQYRSYHTKDELCSWYEEANFEPVTILPQRVSGVGTKRAQSRPAVPETVKGRVPGDRCEDDPLGTGLPLPPGESTGRSP